MTNPWNRAGHFALWFLSFSLSSSSSSSFSSSSSSSSSRNRSRRRVDVYHTSTHGVALVRIQNEGLKCAARDSLEIQDAKMTQKNRHLGTIAQLCRVVSSQLRHALIIGKKLLSSNTSTCPRNMMNFGPVTAEICWRVWGTPANLNGFRILAALLHGTLVVASAKSLRR